MAPVGKADAQAQLKQLPAHKEVSPLLSDGHFCVDGTQLQAWASMKSFVPKEPGAGDDAGAPPSSDPAAAAPAAAMSGNAAATSTGRCADTRPLPGSADVSETKPEHRNADVNFHGQKRSNVTHISTTDAEARLYRKGRGKEANSPILPIR